MRSAKVLILIAAAMVPLAFSAGARGVAITSPVNTPFTGEFKSASAGHVVLDNPIARIECQSTLNGVVDGHGTEESSASVSGLSFTPCTNSWHVTVVTGGGFSFQGIGGNIATVRSTGATIEATRFGITCRYATSNTDVGRLTSGTLADLHLEGAMPFHGGSALCGSSATTWTGAYVVTNPMSLTIDP